MVAKDIKNRVEEKLLSLYLRLRYDKGLHREVSNKLTVFFFVLGVSLLILPHVLNAQSMTQINPLYTKLTALFTGPIGKALAVFAFIVAGIMGSWGILVWLLQLLLWDYLLHLRREL